MSLPDPIPPVRRPRHLLDPDDLHRSHQRSQGTKDSLSNVQKWVVSVLAVTTIGHLAGGVALLGIFMPDDRLDARIGLALIAAVIGVIAVATGLFIHGKRPLSWWLLLGLVPGIVGAWFTFS